jgi:NodT family efflux transporter outer membrane factor (OMF) lipoprotein
MNARLRRGATAVLSVALVTGCNVGPRYVRPAAPAPRAFKESSAAAYEGAPAGTWELAKPDDAALKGKWWRIFGEPELDALEDRLDINNQTIAQYFESFMAARAQVEQARAGYFPTLAVSPFYSKSGGGRGSTSFGGGTGAGAGTTVPAATATTVPTAAGTSSGGFGGGFGNGSFMSLPAVASWAPDLWDRVRNTVRQYRYAAQVSAADLENERLTEQAALAQYYFELRGQDALIELYRRTIQADRQSLEYTRAQADTGIGLEEAVAQAEVTLRNVEATATGLATNRAVYEHAIATLIGKPASDFSMPFATLSTQPPAIPALVPSRVLQRRPDIAAAERTLAQANALVGVAKAAYFPSLNLNASTGFSSSALGTLFSAPSFFWSLGASASQTIFDGGLRRATVAQYAALYRADVAAYRQTVLTAFQQVEDSLATLRITSQQVGRQEAAVDAATRYLRIATARYETGLAPYLDVVTAQGVLLTDQQTLVTLRVTEVTAAVQLVQALGGGWDVGQLPTASEVTSDQGVQKVSGPR